MHRFLFHLICLLLLSALASAEDAHPAATYGRVTMSNSREYEWMDLFGIKANELTAHITDPVFGARVRIEVWEPTDKDKPRWTETFGGIYTFTKKTPINCTLRLYFVPPKLKEVVTPQAYPAWLTLSVERPGDWAENDPIGWNSQKQVAFPDNYLGIEGYHLSVSANLYEVHTEKFDRPLPFFHYGLTSTSFSMRATPEETRKANPHAVHIIGYLVPLLELNDFYHPKRTAAQTSQSAPTAPEAPLLAPGTSMPEWNFEKISGGKFSSSALHGKISVLNFWATWCVNCLVEMPTLVELQEKYGARGVQFAGLNVDRGFSVPGLQRFIKWNFADHPISFPMVLVPPSAERLFGNIDTLPSTYVVDADGKVVYGCKGKISKADLEKRLEDLLSAKK